MMQAKMYKPMKFEKPMLSSDQDTEITSYGKQKDSSYTPAKANPGKVYDLSAYNEAAGIQPKQDVFKPYKDVLKTMNTPASSSTGGLAGKLSAAQADGEDGEISDFNLSDVSASDISKPTGTLKDYMPAYNAMKATAGTAPMSTTGGTSPDNSYNWDDWKDSVPDTSGMDDEKKNLYEDFQTGMSQESQNAMEAYREAERQRKIQLQNAYINSELTKKYMPVYLKQAGMGGLGVSQSALAQIGNDYQNNVSGVNSEYDSAGRDIYKDYTGKLNEAKNQLTQGVREYDLVNAESARKNLASELQEKLTADTAIQGNLNNGKLKLSVYKDLLNRLNTNKGELKDQYDVLIQSLNQFKPDVMNLTELGYEVEDEYGFSKLKAQSGNSIYAKDFENGKRFNGHVVYNGKFYKVK